jgi:hypothetical protein
MEADQEDLEGVQANEDYAKQGADFQGAIENALLTAKPSKTRRRNPFERAKLVVKIFEDTPQLGIPKDVANLISSYVVDVPSMGPKTKTAKKTIGEIMGTLPETERISDIVNHFLFDDDTEDDEGVLYMEYRILYNQI